MLHINSLDEGIDIFKALGSEMRVRIIHILTDNGEMNMNELALRLNITNGALTSHIRQLEECGIVSVSNESAGHGNQKKCSVNIDKILIDINESEDTKNIYNADIKVGHYCDYDVAPTCGLASASALIGEMDDARYFAHPDRFNADILWFTKGYVEYELPNFIPSSQKIDQISVSSELCSEAPGVNNNWPSDIHFYLNGKCLGSWTSPGDFGDVHGVFTPDWWYKGLNQYGLLKLIAINKKGSFIDGIKISDVNIDDFSLTNRSSIKFRFAVPDDTEHVGGLTIFGRTFGNYSQDIHVQIHYTPV